MYDIRDWIAPIKCELHNITNPHTFVIKKNEAGKILLRYKHWSGDTEWLPSKDADDGIAILKEDLSVLKDIPSLSPSSPDKVDLERLRRDIPKFLKNSRVINEEQKEWWQTFFEKADEMYGTPVASSRVTWLLDDLKLIKFGPVARAATHRVENSSVGDSVVPVGVSNEVIQLVSAQHEEIPQVYTGPYKRAENIARVENLWHHISIGDFVAVSIEGSEKPVIGKVFNITETQFEIHYWRGSINTKWTPWLTNEKLPWNDKLPKECVYLADFHLDSNSKLQPDTRRQIRQFKKSQKEKDKV